MNLKWTWDRTRHNPKVIIHTTPGADAPVMKVNGVEVSLYDPDTAAYDAAHYHCQDISGAGAAWLITGPADSYVSASDTWEITDSWGSVLLPISCSWKIFNEKSISTSWKLLNLKDQASSWRLFKELLQGSAWKILKSGPVDLSWRLLSKTSRAMAWKIFNAKDQVTAWNVLKITDRDLAYKIFLELGKDITWSIDSDIIPQPVREFFQPKRNFAFNAKKRIFIFYQKEK